MQFKILTFAVLTLFSATTLGLAVAEENVQNKPGQEYKNWTKFFSYVEKPATKQIREGFINAIGARSEQGKPFPNGTVFVMEIYNAKVDEKGELLKDGSGKLVKGDLSKIYVMEKKENFSAQYKDQANPTGDWEFRAYDSQNKIIAHNVKETESCRVCHVPAANSDYVLRYDEFFVKK